MQMILNLTQKLGTEMFLVLITIETLIVREAILRVKFGRQIFRYISTSMKLFIAAIVFFIPFNFIIFIIYPSKETMGLLLLLALGLVFIVINDGIRQKGIISGWKWIPWDRVTGYDVTDINSMKNVIIYTNKRNQITKKVVAIDWLLLEEKAERVTNLIDEHIAPLSN